MENKKYTDKDFNEFCDKLYIDICKSLEMPREFAMQPIDYTCNHPKSAYFAAVDKWQCLACGEIVEVDLKGAKSMGVRNVNTDEMAKAINKVINNKNK